MDLITNETIAKAVRAAMADVHNGCYPTEHREFIDALIEKERRKADLYAAIQSQVFGWGIIALIGAIGTYVVNHLGIKI